VAFHLIVAGARYSSSQINPHRLKSVLPTRRR
jgi:hypothetical protein